MKQIDELRLMSFAEADRMADEFEAILAKHSVKIRCGSLLEEALLVLSELRHRHEQPANFSPWTGLGADLSKAVGIIRLVGLVLQRANHPEFSKMVPHLQSLNEGSFQQTTPAPATGRASDKIFELELGLAVLKSAVLVEMDDPSRSSGGENPDVIARMRDGKDWGFACKAVHGDAPKTLFQRLVEGVQQIENSRAEIGIVVLTLKNRLPPSELRGELAKDSSGTPLLLVSQNTGTLAQQLKLFVDRRVQSMVSEVGQEEISRIFRGRKALPGLLSPVTVGIVVRTAIGQVPSTFGFLQLLKLEHGILYLPSRFDRRVKQVISDLNEGFRDVGTSIT